MSKKFDDLYKRQKPSFHKSEWVKNISNKQLTQNEETLLGKGLNFATHHTKNDVLTFIANVDRCIDDIKNLTLDERNNLKQRVATSVNNAPQKSNLTQSEQRTLKNLRDDDSITIAPADKGRVTVVLNSTDYINKCENHLNNSNVYAKIDTDPTTKLKNKMNKLLLQLQQHNSELTYR